MWSEYRLPLTHTHSLDLNNMCGLRELEPTNVYFFNQIQLLLVWLVERGGKEGRGAETYEVGNDG